MPSTTIIVASLYILFGVASLAIWVLFLRLGLMWARAEDVSFSRLSVAVVLSYLRTKAVLIFAYFVSPRTLVAVLSMVLIESAIAVAVQCFVIKYVFNLTFPRAIQAWLPTLGTSAVVIAFSLLVFRPYLVEAFICPTNSMAPTLVGPHVQGTCDVCEARAYCSQHSAEMICENGFHVSEVTDLDERVFSGDRFITAKFLRPRRWDLILHQYPENPSELYVKRLVGLPGEVITIKDGDVFANGKKLTRPDEILGIEYQSTSPSMFSIPDELWGSESRPAQLDEDEYFVLGDFSASSRDSRHWEQGAPGHNAFAVPESHLRGVVTHIYWPPSRWRAFR